MAILNDRAFRVSVFHPSTQHGKILLNILRWVLKSAHAHLFIVLFTFIFFIDDTQGLLIFYMAFISAVICARLVGMSLIVLKVHFSTDIIIKASFGFLGALISIKVLE